MDREKRPPAAVTSARRLQQKLRSYQEKLEQRPKVAFSLQANRRFKQIEGKHLALVISLISLLITSLDVSATAQVAYARAFSMAPLRGTQKYVRGATWLIVLLAFTIAALMLRALAASRPLWVTGAAGAVLLLLQFGYFLITPGCC